MVLLLSKAERVRESLSYGGSFRKVKSTLACQRLFVLL
ncbi:hypothetical protein RV00_GL003045 [Enterococcus devriesei]|uniref:Uncharacterized protein n=1 Tax=Enterococcus devriesei TaxID=319970 RepID=A0A1L8STP3_9ENTE|nr:hypothetical protein RV00_GL003045 [Enterococcus devriesei]